MEQIKKKAERLKTPIFQATIYSQLISKKAQDDAGFTLIELVVVMAIMALFGAFVLPRIQDQIDLHIKKHARQLSGTIRFLYTQSAMKNRIYRLHYDLDQSKYWVEKSQDSTLQLKREDEDPMFRKKMTEGHPSPREGSPEEKFRQDTDLLKKPVELQKKIIFKSIKTTASEEPYTFGHAYTHFFPSGYAEPTQIKLEHPKGKIYTIEVNPLTGSTKIYNYDTDEKK